MIKFNTLACGMALAVSGLAAAQEAVQETTRTTTTPDGTTTTEVRRVSQVIGSNVALQGANDFGKVEDIVLNDNGCIEYVVVTRGGQYAMLPWDAASLNYGRRVVTFNVAPQVIQPLFFARNAWPSVSDTKYVGRVREVFRRGPGRRDVLRPAPNGPPGRVVLPPGTQVPPPGAPVGEERVKIKEKKDGTERVKIKR